MLQILFWLNFYLEGNVNDLSEFNENKLNKIYFQVFLDITFIVLVWFIIKTKIFMFNIRSEYILSEVSEFMLYPGADLNRFQSV